MKRLVATAAEIPEGAAIAVDVGDRRIAIFRHRGKLYALDETCPHRGGPLHEGEIEGGVVSCPWHAWQFELSSGCSPVNPLSRVRTYEVTVEDGGGIWVEIEQSPSKTVRYDTWMREFQFGR